MAYTSVIPVHRLDRSIEYVKDKEKTTQKADSLEAAIDYAMNRTKTEQAVFEDTIGCTNENAYEDMLATKKRFHKMGGVEGYHLVQSFAEGEVTPELAHLIGQELADRLLKVCIPLRKLFALGFISCNSPNTASRSTVALCLISGSNLLHSSFAYVFSSSESMTLYLTLAIYTRLLKSQASFIISIYFAKSFLKRFMASTVDS